MSWAAMKPTFSSKMHIDFIWYDDRAVIGWAWFYVGFSPYRLSR